MYCFAHAYAICGAAEHCKIACTRSERALPKEQLGRLVVAKEFGYDWISSRHRDKAHQGPYTLGDIGDVLVKYGVKPEAKEQAAREFVARNDFIGARWHETSQGYVLRRGRPEPVITLSPEEVTLQPYSRDAESIDPLVRRVYDSMQHSSTRRVIIEIPQDSQKNNTEHFKCHVVWENGKSHTGAEYLKHKLETLAHSRHNRHNVTYEDHPLGIAYGLK